MVFIHRRRAVTKASSQVSAPMHPWMCGLTLENGRRIRGYALKGNRLFISQQLSICQHLLRRGGALCHLSSLCWGFVWLAIAQNYACYCNISESMRATTLLGPANTASLESSAPSDLTLFPPSLPQWLVSLWRKGCDIDVPFRAKPSTVSCSLNVGQLCVSMLVAQRLWIQFLWWGLRGALIY